MSELFSSSRRVSARTSALLAAALIVLLALGAYLALVLLRLDAAVEQERVADAALGAVREVALDLLDAETGQRGYLLTGNETYLEPYLAAHKRVRTTMHGALSGPAPDARYSTEMGRLALLAAVALEELERTVALRKSGDPARAMQIVDMGHAKATMDEARGLIDNTVTRIRTQRDQARRAVPGHLTRAAAAALGIALMLGGLLWASWRRVAGNARSAARRNRALVEDALHDSLTGLPNRRFFDSVAGQALKQLERGSAPVSLLLIDLDGIERINDSAGRAAGAGVLTAAAQRLRKILRGGEFVARLDGNRFALLVSSQVARNDLQGLGERVVRTLQGALAPQAPPLDAHVGIATAGAGAYLSLDALLAAAEGALYTARRAGRGAVRFHGRRTRQEADAGAAPGAAAQPGVPGG